MSDKKNCAGTYKVSGYTKSDGTKVSSYMRTCGAKHEGDNNSSEKHSRSGSAGMTGGAAGVEHLQNWSDLYMQIINDENYVRSPEYIQEILELKNSSNAIYHNYYKLSLEYNHYKNINKENSYIKFKDLTDENIKSFIKQEYKKNNINIQDTTNVVIPQQDSKLVKTVYSSPEFKNSIMIHLGGIKSGKYISNFFPIEFNQTTDAHLIIGKAKLYNMRVVDGYICGTLIDYYDFESRWYINAKSIIKSLYYTLANEMAYRQQEAHKLTNYLIAFPIRIPLNKFN